MKQVNPFNNEKLQLEEIVFSAPTKKIQSTKPAVSKLLAMQDEINRVSKTIIQFASPIITVNDKALIFPKTITVIQGKTGAHKSRLAEYLASTLISKEMETPLLGLKNVSLNEIVVAYIDTERNKSEQFPYAIQSMKLNAGYQRTEDIQNFEFTSLLDTKRKFRLIELTKYLEYLFEKHSKPIVVIMDVLTDCISNFNDPEESMKFVDMLNRLINDYNVTFIGVIHENPSSQENKARGHIGTEISNKATTVLSLSSIKGSRDLFEIKFLKCRSTEQYGSLNIKYNKNSRKLEFADEIDGASLKQSTAPYSELMTFLIDTLGNRPAERKELISKICIQFECSSRTAIDRLDKILDSQKLKEHGYSLIYEDVPEKKLNKKQYRLVELNMDGEFLFE